MNDSKNRFLHIRIELIILILALVGTCGIWLANQLSEQMFRPSARWSDNQIHVYSAKDGPWYVTHLVAYTPNGYWRAVAQLPEPITIIDSRGHYFDQEQIDTFEWLDTQGEKQTPPTAEEEVGVMYLIPHEGKRTTKK